MIKITNVLCTMKWGCTRRITLSVSLLIGLLVQNAMAIDTGFIAAPTLHPRIANGIATTDWPTAVSLVPINSQQNSCGGVLVDCQTVMTAAHCVCDGNDSDDDGVFCQSNNDSGLLISPGDMEIFFQYAPPVTVSSVQVPIDYDFGVRSDVALLTLESPVEGLRPTPINTQQTPSFGTTGTKVGYGPSSELAGTSDSGIKRQGEVNLASCNPAGVDQNEHLCWNFPGQNNAGSPGEDANTCPGDSGGPMFVDFGQGPVVAGITSGGSAECQDQDAAYDADVYVNRSWILARINPPTGGICGDLAPVGDNGTSIVALTGFLNTTTTTATYTLSVDNDTERLRVALNGEDDTDMDLSVGLQGQTPLCTSDQGGAFEFCEFNSPTAGMWEIVVTNFSNATGQYQLVSTQFGGSSNDDLLHSDGFETSTSRLGR